jgi:hypothetical protein
MSYVTFPTVQNVIDAVSQDVRTQLVSQTGSIPAQQAALIDYTNRISKQMLRFSRWTFLKSEPLFFVTQLGQNFYWLGAKGQGPAGTVDTGLNLQDVYIIKRDSVNDLSNQQPLKWLSSAPMGPNLIDRTGAGRPGLPAVFSQNPNDPNILSIYPPPNNQNNTQPSPQVPVVTYQPGGALPQRTYIVKVTIVDQLNGESTSTTTGAPILIPANNLLVVKSPATGTFGILPPSANVAQNMYNRYNVYANTATITNGVISNEGSEVLQNGGPGPISIGTDFIEPTSGLVLGTANAPTKNTLQPVGAYVIKFEYFKNRVNLTAVGQFLQIPDDYFDVVVNGVTFYAYKILGKKQEAMQAYQQFTEGMRSMIWDKNQFPSGVEFIRPDSNSYVNTQILGYLDPFF